MFAGRSEAAGPVDVDRRNSELVPSAGSDVSQLDALLCSLRDRWEGKQTTGVRVYAGSQPRVSLLPHQSSCAFSLCQTFKDTATVRNAQPRATVCQRSASSSTAVACGTLGHVNLILTAV